MFTPINFISEDDPKELKFPVSVTSLRKFKENIYIVTNRPKLFSKDFIDTTDGIFDSCEALSQDKIASAAFYIYFSRGDFALPQLERIIKGGGLFVSPSVYNRIPFWQNSDSCIEIYNQMAWLLQTQPKGSIAEFGNIMQAVRATQHLEGDYVEIGVVSGSSALAALLYMQRLGIRRKCWLLDTYAGFNYEVAKGSPDIKWYGTHGTWGSIELNGANAIERIKRLTASTGQDVYPQEFNVCHDSFPDSVQKIVMANLDVDIYEGTLRGLQILAPRIVSGGIITTEDPTSTHGLYGAYYALHEFLESEEGQKFICLRTDTTYFLIRR